MIKKALFFIFILIVSFQAGFKGYQLQEESRPVHIYMDIASMPSFLQMLDFVKTNKKDKKYIAWKRYPNRGELIDLKAYNTEQIELPKRESLYKETYEVLEKAMRRIAQENKGRKFILHGNLHHVSITLETAMKAIAPEDIREIYLYEDGMINVFESRKGYALSPYNTSPACPKHIRDFQENKANSLNYNNVFCIHKLYKTTYYISFLEQIKQDPAFKNLLSDMDGARLVQIDFKKFANQLTAEQKHLLYQLLGFDYDGYKKLIQGKRTVFYTLGWLQEISDNLLLVDIFNRLKEKELKNLLDDEKTVLFFKGHPSPAAHFMQEELLKTNPKAFVFPRTIPFELLIVAGLSPDYVLGFSSSTFFSLDPQKILYYITIDGDKNLQALKKLNILSDEKVIDIHHFIKKETQTP